MTYLADHVRRYACFTMEDGVYEHAQGEHVSWADYVKMKEDAFHKGRAQGYREGQEAMRERAALTVPTWHPSNRVQQREIRALPVEELPLVK